MIFCRREVAAKSVISVTNPTVEKQTEEGRKREGGGRRGGSPLSKAW